MCSRKSGSVYIPAFIGRQRPSERCQGERLLGVVIDRSGSNQRLPQDRVPRLVIRRRQQLRQRVHPCPVAIRVALRKGPYQLQCLSEETFFARANRELSHRFLWLAGSAVSEPSSYGIAVRCGDRLPDRLVPK